MAKTVRVIPASPKIFRSEVTAERKAAQDGRVRQSFDRS